MASEHPVIYALCVGRHPYLSDHFARYFAAFGFSTKSATGLAHAVELAGKGIPDIVICDYDLLATLPLEDWENDDLLSRTAVIAVSLSRRPTETHLLDVNGIAGFLYLPTLDRAVGRKILIAAAVSSRARYVAAPAVSSTVDKALNHQIES